ncbi:MAG: hypothetical protein OXC62_17225 [Aestuariivita sp.]|nr:hypothetical protein [Aestuariivita sp.]
MPIVRTVYYLLVFLCIGISLYLTYYGFEKTFQGLTIPFTIVIGLLLFAADYLIQRNRERGFPWVPAFFLFLLAAVFSGLSNFNALYTNFMTVDVVAATVREQYRIFQQDLTNTRTRLMEQPEVREEDERQKQLENELQNTWTQMNDAERLGCGERCARHIDRINELLGENITELRRPGPDSSWSQRKQFYDTFRNRVLETLRNQNATGPLQDIRSVMRLIDDRLERSESAIDALQKTGFSSNLTLSAEDGEIKMLSQLSSYTEDVEREANTVLPNNQKVNHQYIDPTLGRLGEIVYSLKNGFVEVPRLSATIMAAILAIMIDFIPILYALVAFRPGEGITPETTSNDYDVLG